MIKQFIRMIFLLLGMSTVLLSYAEPAQTWQQFIAGLRVDAVAEGIHPTLFDQLFNGMQPGLEQIRLDQTQPEKRITYVQYRDSRVDKFRIFIGQRECKSNKILLQTIGKQYQVDPSYVVAIWGMESSYGYFPGNFPVIKSLATLAYRSKRKELFRQELLYALKIVNDGHITPDQFKGEWAGASGQCQFLPSSWYKYAVDFNHNGRKNIWTDKADALASIANYLKLNGWQYHEPLSIQVKLPDDWQYADQIGAQNVHSVEYWLEHGVIVPKVELKKISRHANAAIITPDGGPDYMVFDNFRVLLTYNNSIYYGAAIGYLATKVNQECQVD